MVETTQPSESRPPHIGTVYGWEQDGGRKGANAYFHIDTQDAKLELSFFQPLDLAVFWPGNRNRIRSVPRALERHLCSWRGACGCRCGLAAPDSDSRLMASSIQATARLHWWAAAFLHATSAGSTLVVADALVHALVTRALYQVSHTGGTAIRVTLTGHAALGAREACSTGAATLVQCTVKGLPSTMLPHTEVLLIGAGTTFYADLLIFILFHQSIMVVHLFHATQLIQFQAAISTCCTWIIKLQGLHSGFHVFCNNQSKGKKTDQELDSHRKIEDFEDGKSLCAGKV